MTHLVILAAGLGSRFGGNKQLVEFGTQQLTLMEYNIAHAVKAGFTQVTFIIREELKPLFNNAILPRLPKQLSINFIYQSLENIPQGTSLPLDRIKPLGTAHALWCAKKLLIDKLSQSPYDKFAVINADDYYGETAFSLLFQGISDKRGHYLQVAYPLENTLSEYGGVNRGLCQLSNNHQLTSIVECTNIILSKNDLHGDKISGHCINEARINSTLVGTGSKDEHSIELSPQSLVSMNCWLFTNDIFPALEEHIIEMLRKESMSLTAECYLPTVVMKQISRGQICVDVTVCPDEWFGVTYKEDIAVIASKLE